MNDGAGLCSPSTILNIVHAPSFRANEWGMNARVVLLDTHRSSPNFTLIPRQCTLFYEVKAAFVDRGMRKHFRHSYNKVKHQEQR
jgi:hypothetical protein